jgi:hypothetical protein
MSERERWIVYPLLFLALGVALRDELFDQTWSRHVVCEQLTLIDGESSPLAPLQTIGSLGRHGLQTVRAGGQLNVDVVRAGTVIADRFTSGRAEVVPQSTIMDFLRRLQQTAQSKAAEQAAASAAKNQEVQDPEEAGSGANEAGSQGR